MEVLSSVDWRLRSGPSRSGVRAGRRRRAGDGGEEPLSFRRSGNGCIPHHPVQRAGADLPPAIGAAVGALDRGSAGNIGSPALGQDVLVDMLPFHGQHHRRFGLAGMKHRGLPLEQATDFRVGYLPIGAHPMGSRWRIVSSVTIVSRAAMLPPCPLRMRSAGSPGGWRCRRCSSAAPAWSRNRGSAFRPARHDAPTFRRE